MSVEVFSALDMFHDKLVKADVEELQLELEDKQKYQD